MWYHHLEEVLWHTELSKGGVRLRIDPHCYHQLCVLQCMSDKFFFLHISSNAYVL